MGIGVTMLVIAEVILVCLWLGWELRTIYTSRKHESEEPEVIETGSEARWNPVNVVEDFYEEGG